MVSSGISLRRSLLTTVDTHQSDPLHLWLLYVWTAKTMLWATSTHRNRATLREGLVRDYGNMSGYDDIQGGGWSLVLGDVRCSVDWKGLGMDWRWESRSSGTTTACQSTSISRPSHGFLGNVSHIRLMVDAIHNQYGHTTSTAKYDGNVPVRICHPDDLLTRNELPILYIFSRSEGCREADAGENFGTPERSQRRTSGDDSPERGCGSYGR